VWHWLVSGTIPEFHCHILDWVFGGGLLGVGVIWVVGWEWVPWSGWGQGYDDVAIQVAGDMDWAGFAMLGEDYGWFLACQDGSGGTFGEDDRVVAVQAYPLVGWGVEVQRHPAF